MISFWKTLPKPIIGLSPMDGVTDAPCRFIAAKYGQPSVQFTEFVHVQGLWVGKLEVFKDLIYDELERPIVAQIFGAEPSYFYNAAHIVCALGFDGIDINMGCPAKAVVEKGGGASLIQDPERAKAIIRSTKQGVQDWVSGQSLEKLGLEAEKIRYIHHYRQEHQQESQSERIAIPVSVKTRIGLDTVVVEAWVSHLLEAQPAVISIHGRTLKQMYSGCADWEAIGSVVDLIHQAGALCLGNGDVGSVEQAHNRVASYGVDGVLIGRAIFGNPWLFQNKAVSMRERLQVALEHCQKFTQIKGERRFHEMRKHLAWYASSFEGAKDLRVALLKTLSLQDVAAVLQPYLET